MQVPFTNIACLKNDFTTEVPFISSAYNYTLYRHVTAEKAILHLWTTPKQVALGPRDKQLPDFEGATAWLAANDFKMYNRNAGGLAVIGDRDILNGSLIFQQPATPLSINEAYELVAILLQKALPALKLVIGEVATSYCPGSYDISVGTQKIAGLAQHRYQNKIAVSFYLSIAGDQAYRCQIIRQMYLIGLQAEQISAPYPDVTASSMTTLADISAYTMAEVVTNLQTNWFQMTPFNRQQLDLAILNHQIAQLTRRQAPEVVAHNH